MFDAAVCAFSSVYSPQNEQNENERIVTEYEQKSKTIVGNNANDDNNNNSNEYNNNSYNK